MLRLLKALSTKSPYLPAYYEELRRQFPNALIHLEDGEGSRLWSK
jgi:hypothetical protein